MRKLVNLFATISLVITPTSSVIACRRDTTESTKAQNEATADDIIMRLNNFLKSQPHLECSESYSNLNDPQTTLALNQVLASNGLQLNGNPGKPSIAGAPYVASSGE